MRMTDELQHNNPYQATSVDTNDEIDLIQLAKTIWKYRKIFFCFIVGGVLMTGLYTKTFAPKQYRASTTFFLPQNDSNHMAGFGALKGYAQVLGVNSSSNLEAHIMSIIKSKRLRLLIASQFQEEFVAEINDLNSKVPRPLNERQVLTFISHQLRLGKRISITVDKNNLFTLSYFINDPKVAYRVIQECLIALRFLSQELGLAAQKKIIVTLDEPQIPSSYFKPRLSINLVLGFLISSFIGMLAVFIYYLYV